MTAGRHCGPAGAQNGISVETDSEAPFRAAIAAGVLSGEPADPNWAGRYLYMFHDADGVARFRHRDRRTHLTVPPDRAGGPA